MHNATTSALNVAQGPLFRFAFALAVLGLARLALLGLSGMVAGYVTAGDRAVFRRKLRLHLLWSICPSMVINTVRPFGSRAMYAYHVFLCCTSLLFRFLVVVLPVFLVAHVYLWERALGISWPSLPSRLADILSITIIVSGVVLFLGRIYSPALRTLEPPWTFFKPVLLLVPFITGMLVRHPTWSPMSYYGMLLLHVLSAAGVLILIPFTRLLSNMHTRLRALVPDAAWRPAEEDDAKAGMAMVRR
ncbi:MAG TPA: hypothetical protein VMV94_07490 [Phycisphaerae bacterium]|nr:hypothetical protein [Phycisphaerae bacterium]